MTGPEIARFWAKVNKTGPGGCWIWTASRNVRRGGYGQVRIGGRVRRAHVVAYELSVGPVPEGMQLDHRCNVTSCVNPQHLVPEPARANNARSGSPSAVAGRATTCVAGHPLAGPHLYRRPDGRRECRTCANERQRERRAA